MMHLRIRPLFRQLEKFNRLSVFFFSVTKVQLFFLNVAAIIFLFYYDDSLCMYTEMNTFEMLWVGLVLEWF